MLLRVFEHQTLRVGECQEGVLFTETHFDILTKFHSKASKYYSLRHKGVRFSHYVGVLQVNDLTIEILPKADKASQAEHKVWHTVLVDMLSYCRLLKVESLSSAHLQLRPHSILDLYYEIFLEKVEHLLKTGLLKSYRRQQKQSSVLKGKLILSEHLQRNLIHKERFYIDYQTYDYEHPLNQIIYAALLRLDGLLTRPDLRTRQRLLLRQFPKQIVQTFKEKDFLNLHYDRQSMRYKEAVEIARLLLLNYRPDLQAGQFQVLAILFDMNLLFEEYVYQQLKRLQHIDLKVSRQQSTPFWNRRFLRPDLIIEYNGYRFVLDTKWKVLKRVHPDMEDVKQMYIYNQYFSTKRGVLLYPQVHDLPNLPPVQYSSLSGDKMYCEINFLNIIKDGRLNKKLGQELVNQLMVFDV